MTRFQEFPIRPQGQAWPGLNTRGGLLDPGSGQLEEGSFNQIINEGDLLEKRPGFVRGIEERFSGPVCGLFVYTDECGREFLLVADQDSISIRTPFDIPTFLGQQSLPFDSFEGDLSKWTNTDAYTTSQGSLVLSGSDLIGANGFVPESQFLEWFKDSVVESYFVEIQYNLEAGELQGQQVASVITKRTGSSYLIASVVLDESIYQVNLELVENGVRATLNTQDLDGRGLGSGFLRLNYDSPTFTLSVRVIPAGGTPVNFSEQINELQANSLGQGSAIGMQRESLNDDPEIESVSGGRL